jgi:hypothetical protein
MNNPLEGPMNDMFRNIEEQFDDALASTTVRVFLSRREPLDVDLAGQAAAAWSLVWPDFRSS